MMRTAASLAILIASSISEAAAGDGAAVCERHMEREARRHGVPLGVLYAVGLTETGRKASLQPFALNIAGTAYYAHSRRDALRRFAAARRDGIRSVDLGCMQINHHWHKEHFASVEDMLEPENNVAYAARFLKRLNRRYGSWTLAVARYHAGPDHDARQKRYVCAVISNMVATGFGAWTPAARRFCGRKLT